MQNHFMTETGFLHSHPRAENDLGLDEIYAVVLRRDLLRITEYLENHPSVLMDIIYGSDKKSQ